MLFEKIELEAGEQVLTVVRKHWFIISVEIIGILIASLLPVFVAAIFIVVPALHPTSFVLADQLPLILFAVSFWLLFTFLTCFMIWTHYYLDLWMITDRRVIAIDQIHFFNRKVSSFRLERLQDIKVAINGIIPTLLDFGTIHVHTAGNNEENFTTTGLPEPRELQALIQKATDARLQSLHGAATQTIIN
jgi:Bacterial PH domain